MAKTSYLNITNRTLRRINENVITDVTTTTGKSKIITDLVNEAQSVLYSEAINWYSLYATATITTVAGTGEYALPSDHGRTIVMINETQDYVMVEDFIKNLDIADPNRGEQASPTHFTIQAGNYRLYPIPSAVETLRYRYYKVPAALSANANTSDLPIECEPALMEWVNFQIYEYLKQYESADRSRLTYDRLLKRAKIANDKILDMMYTVGSARYGGGVNAPRFPAQFPHNGFGG